MLLLFFICKGDHGKLRETKRKWNNLENIRGKSFFGLAGAYSAIRVKDAAEDLGLTEEAVVESKQLFR